jgi:hypothetical protein
MPRIPRNPGTGKAPVNTPARGPKWDKGLPGYGPAKGPGNHGPGPGRPRGVRDGEGKKTVADLMIAADARRIAADAWMVILQNPSHPRHADMVMRAAERMDGAPVQSVRVMDADPEQMTDAELEAIARGGRRSAAGEAGS